MDWHGANMCKSGSLQLESRDNSPASKMGSSPPGWLAEPMQLVILVCQLCTSLWGSHIKMLMTCYDKRVITGTIWEYEGVTNIGFGKGKLVSVSYQRGPCLITLLLSCGCLTHSQLAQIWLSAQNPGRTDLLYNKMRCFNLRTGALGL